MRNWDVLTLDHTGNTIPATYHSPDDPDGAVFMATNGSDSNDGRSEDRPVKTLNRAVTVAPNGATVCFRGGRYNDCYKNTDGSYKVLADKCLTYTSYLGEPVTFDGGGRLPFLMVHGNRGNPGKVVAFKGFEITNYAGDWGGSIGNVPLYLGDGDGSVYVLEDMLIRKNAGCGVNLVDPRGDLGDCRVVRTVFSDNGSVGLTDTGSVKAKAPTGPTTAHVNDLWVSHCYFGRNNQNNVQKPYEGGAKLHNNNKVTCFGNIVEDTVGNYGHGLWTDVTNLHVRFVCNFVRRCGSAGLFTEVGEDGWFVSNIVLDCGLVTNQANIRIADFGPRVLYNTSVVTPGAKSYIPIEIYDDVRNYQTDGYARDTDNVQMASNLFTGPSDKYGFLCYLYSNGPAHAGGGTQPSQFFNQPGFWGKNAWFPGAGKGHVRWAEGGSTVYKTAADLQKARGVGGTDIVLTDDPFVDRKKYRVKSSSPAYAKGIPLPADVADLLGYTAGQTFPMGYIDCPIPTW